MAMVLLLLLLSPHHSYVGDVGLCEMSHHLVLLQRNNNNMQ